MFPLITWFVIIAAKNSSSKAQGFQMECVSINIRGIQDAENAISSNREGASSQLLSYY